MEQFRLEKMEIDLGDEFNEAKASLSSFKEIIEKLKSYIKDPKNVLYEYFSDLRSKIDLDREIIRNKVDEHYLGLIDDVDEIEAECKSNELKNKNIFTGMIENEEKKLSKFKEDLDALKIDTKKWNNLITESNLHIAIVNRKIKDFESELFLNHNYTYERANFDEYLNKSRIMQTSMKQSNFEEFGSIYLNLNKFKKFSETRGLYPCSNIFIFNELIWELKLDNDGGYLGCYINCDPGTINKEVSCKVKIQLNNIKDEKKIHTQSFDFKYTENEAKGNQDFILLRDVFNNGFYDKENDSLYFTIFIQIKDIK